METGRDNFLEGEYHPVESFFGTVVDGFRSSQENEDKHQCENKEWIL